MESSNGHSSVGYQQRFALNDLRQYNDATAKLRAEKGGGGMRGVMRG